MKKFLILLLLISTVSQAQYSIKGKIHPPKKYSWALLYKVEGARQKFVKNAQIEKSLETTDGKTRTVGTFEFSLPEDTESGAYRVTYDLQNNGFIDFLFNKEDVEFSFNPGDVEGTTMFTQSKENQLYQKFLYDISVAQYKVDSLQVAYLKAPSLSAEVAYKEAIANIYTVQQNYNRGSSGTLASHFIRATDRYNSPTIAKNSQDYLTGVIDHFYDKIDFTNKYLYNSSFLIDRVADYVFYMNYSQNPSEQLTLHKKAVDISIGKVNDLEFKKDVIEFLTSQFAALKNSPLVDYLMTNHYSKLPFDKQNAEFKQQIEESMSVAIGKVAPDFAWTENGQEVKLSELKDGQSYLLIFYSTACSHCLREVPQVFDFMKGKDKTKVIAFAMETSDDIWKNYIKNLPGWHHVLGLNKWENKIARTYQITSTPTYFVLGMDKTIIANPEKLDELKVILEGLD